MGAPEPLYRGCPTVIGRAPPGQPRISLVRANEAPPSAHLPLVEGTEVGLPPFSRERKETEVCGILATKIVPAYVTANNERDEQLFLANKWRDSKEAKPVLRRVRHKVSAHASLGLHDVMWGGTQTACKFWLPS